MHTLSKKITDDFLETSCRRLGTMTEQLEVCLRKLSDAQVWWRGAESENAVGNLVLHLCGNARQWVIHGMGDAADVRLRDKEFSTKDGLSAKELIVLFAGTMTEVRAVINAVPPERLIERITPQGRDVSVMEAIYQVVGHVQQHVGQIILLTKQMTAADLDLTMPRPR